MNKQLYKLISGKFKKLVFVGFFALLTTSCGQESAQEQAATDASEANAGETVQEQITETIEQTSAEVEETLEQPESDAGFLNRDMVLGDPNAPVEIIEYASITCNHCATFHNNVLPRIKEKYVDTGKAKIVVRSFLLNGIDAQGSAISRCVPERRYFAFMDALFERQTEWYDIPEYQRLSGLHDQQTAGQMFVEHTMSEISKIARQVGLNQAKIDECATNEVIGEYLFSIYQEAVDKYKVNSTPTIIVNGNKTNNDYASIERAIEAELD